MRRARWGSLAAMLLACGGAVAPGTPPADDNRIAPQEVVLAVNVVGDGTVRATGLDCRASCTQRVTKGTKLSLRADADAGATFAGWSGGCTGQSCELTLDADAAVTATFNRPRSLHQLTVRVDGRGSVRSAPGGIDCGTTCAASFDSAAQVALMAAPDAGYAFSGWDGSCIGAGACAVSMASDGSVIAKFVALPPQMVSLTVSVAGNGKVTGSGIDCPGSACNLEVAAGTKVTLTAAANKGARFISWVGDCAQSLPACSLTAAQNVSVSASFQDEVVLLVGADGTNLNDLALNSTHVFYWRNGNNVYGIWRVPKTGGAPEFVSAMGGCCFGDPHADDSYVYWTNYYGVYRAPVSGGRPQTIYGGALIADSALDGDQIYWVTTTPSAGQGAVYAGPAGGGAPRALAFADANGSVAVDAQYAYWTSSGGVWRVPKAGGAAERVISCGTCDPRKVQVDADTLYYRDVDGDVWARAKAGGEARKLNTGNPGNTMVFMPIDLEVHARVAYWTWHDNTGTTLQGLFRANADGTAWTALDSGTDSYWFGPRVDDDAIYYFHAGALYRRLK